MKKTTTKTNPITETNPITKTRTKTKTSIGHHTFTISQRILGEEMYSRGYVKSGRSSIRAFAADKLLQDFVNYMCKTNEIGIYIPIRGTGDWRPARKSFEKNGEVTIEHYGTWKIVYKSENMKGLSWTLRYNTCSQDFNEYIVEAKINPKTFLGIQDYITASDSRYLLEVEEKFNIEARKISSILGDFSNYRPKRIDFCINLDLKELGVPCTPEQMMYLIKKSDYSSNFKELQYYDKKSHRYKAPDKNSHYLKSGSVNINCYYKHPQLMEQFPDCPNIEDAQHIIRFEVQCKYAKTYIMHRSEQERMMKEKESRSREYIDNKICVDSDNAISAEKIIHRRFNDDPVKIIYRMLSDITAETIINKYFRQVIRMGDYYPLATAIKMVEEASLSPSTENLIVQTLESINRIGIARTRALIQPQAMSSFYRTLGYLAKMGINPVTIPKSFKVKHIPNLLDAFNKLRDLGGVGGFLVGEGVTYEYLGE